MGRKKIFSKSHIDANYYFKHIGHKVGVWALTNYYILTQQGFPKGVEQWCLLILLNIAILTGIPLSLDGAKKVAK